MTLPSGHDHPTPQDARPRLLAAPAFCGYPKDAKAAGLWGAVDTTGLSPDLEGFLGEGAVGWV